MSRYLQKRLSLTKRYFPTLPTIVSSVYWKQFEDPSINVSFNYTNSGLPEGVFIGHWAMKYITSYEPLNSTPTEAIPGLVRLVVNSSVVDQIGESADPRRGSFVASESRPLVRYVDGNTPEVITIRLAINFGFSYSDLGPYGLGEAWFVPAQRDFNNPIKVTMGRKSSIGTDIALSLVENKTNQGFAKCYKVVPYVDGGPASYTFIIKPLSGSTICAFKCDVFDKLNTNLLATADQTYYGSEVNPIEITIDNASLYPNDIIIPAVGPIATGASSEPPVTFPYEYTIELRQNI